MDWKKETISAAELEKRQKEYMSAAMSMMKRSSPERVPERQQKPVPQPEPAPQTEPEIKQGQEPEEKAPAEAPEPKEKASADAPDPEEKAPAEAPEPKEKAPADTPEPEAKPEPEPAAGTETADGGNDTSYGVYTADELLNGEYHGDGLKKAAEILEEMTRNTEMMKKLADGDGGGTDTTDFPDFSCESDGDGGDSFRGTAGSDPEHSSQEQVPADE